MTRSWPAPSTAVSSAPKSAVAPYVKPIERASTLSGRHELVAAHEAQLRAEGRLTTVEGVGGFPTPARGSDPARGPAS